MIMKYNFESIGNFELTQPIMLACDPRQGEDGAAIFLPDCKLGTWEASVARVNDPFWGHYVAALAVRHIDGPSLAKFKKIKLNSWGSIWDKIKVFVTKITTGIELYPDDLYVASGQAGFFDEEFCWDDNVCKDIGEDVSWDLLCWEISNGEESCGVIPYGVVARSGVESECGCFLYYMVKDHQVVAAMIKFVEDKRLYHKSIFNAQNSVKTDVDEMFSVLIQHVQSDAPYGFWGDYLTHSLFEENEYKDTEDLLSALTGKQRFIPERNLLLQYADPNFIERSPASNRFMRFFCDKMSCSERIAADITSEFSFACQVDASIGKALSLLDTYDLRLTKDRAKELIPLLVDLSNHTRKWSNCGFTPEEIHQQKIRSSSVRQGRKIGRNEPCPCGSGKKYKKCCGF